MKGYILLSEGRSGSNWLSSMANNSKVMGQCSEWLGREYFDKDLREFGEDEFFDVVLEKAKTDNDRFAIKIFPRHVHSIYLNIGFDFIHKCMQEHETKLVVLKRRDTLAQAISWVRGIQTKQWTSRNTKNGKEAYDFPAICRAYFYISRSYQYWDAYLGVNQYDFDSFVYEDLLPDPAGYLESLTEFLDVNYEGEWETELRIQRDNKTNDWLERFREDVKKQGVIGYSGPFGAYGSFSLDEPRVQSSRKRQAKAVVKKFKGIFE